MPAIPNSEPSTLTAGETWQWSRGVSEYPATDGWALKYALQASGKTLITITTTASGADYAVAVPAATTAAYAPAGYLMTAFVEKASDRVIIGHSQLSVLPSPLAALGSTHASRMLALIESALEGRIPNGLEKTDIDGQSLERIPVKDLVELQTRYKALVAGEANSAAMAAGLGNRRNIFARFTRV